VAKLFLVKLANVKIAAYLIEITANIEEFKIGCHGPSSLENSNNPKIYLTLNKPLGQQEDRPGLVLAIN
jgi:hypothetical protein